MPTVASTAASWRDVDAIALEMSTDIDGCVVVPLTKIVSIKFTRSGFSVDAIQVAELSKYAFHSSLLSTSFKSWCAARSLHIKSGRNVCHNFSIDPTDTTKLARPADKTRTVSARVSIASQRVHAKGGALDDEDVLLALQETSTFASVVKKALPPTPPVATRSSQVSDDEAGEAVDDSPHQSTLSSSQGSASVGVSRNDSSSSSTAVHAAPALAPEPAVAAAPAAPVVYEQLPPTPTPPAAAPIVGADSGAAFQLHMTNVVQELDDLLEPESPRGALPPDWHEETSRGLFSTSPRRRENNSPSTSTSYTSMPTPPSPALECIGSGAGAGVGGRVMPSPTKSQYASAFPQVTSGGGSPASAAPQTSNGYKVVVFDPNATGEGGVAAGSFATVDFASMHRANSMSHHASATNYAQMPSQAGHGAAAAAAVSQSPPRSAPAGAASKGVYDSDTLLRFRQDDVSLPCPSCKTLLTGPLADQRKHIAECAVALAIANHDHTLRLRAAALTAAPKSAIEYPFTCSVCGNSYQFECDLQLHASKRHGAAPPSPTPAAQRSLQRNQTHQQFTRR